MGILTGKEILRQMDLGHIEIDPFDIRQLNPNSYNIRLANELMVYDTPDDFDSVRENLQRCIHIPAEYRESIVYGKLLLDTRVASSTRKFEIGDEGFVLKPGKLYLGSTVEKTWSDSFVPIISGRSSVGRKGISIHVTAGFGDIGFRGNWTLEIFALEQIIIHPGDEIGQIYFESAVGDTSYQYNGRYQNQNGVVASRMDEEKRGMYSV